MEKGKNTVQKGTSYRKVVQSQMIVDPNVKKVETSFLEREEQKSKGQHLLSYSTLRQQQSNPFQGANTFKEHLTNIGE